MRTHLKICCIATPEEADLVVAAGANTLGLVSAMSSELGPVDDAAIAAVAAHVRQRYGQQIETFLLTGRADVRSLITQAKACGCTTLQLCDALDANDDGEAYAALRASLPGIQLVQVIHVEDEIALDEAFRAQKLVDAIVLDDAQTTGSKVPSNAPRARSLGFSSPAHDWTLCHRIVGTSTIPVWLAGDINPENVEHAIRAVGPYGIDVSEGIRTNGKLDPTKLDALVSAIQAAQS